MRVYIPATVSDLRYDYISKRLAFAVTDSLRADLLDENDIEVLEDYAMLQASLLSLKLIKPDELSLRMVVSADINNTTDLGAKGLVELNEDVLWSDIACIHIDDFEDMDSISALKTLFDQDPQQAFIALNELSLLWFDKSEKDDLLQVVNSVEGAS